MRGGKCQPSATARGGAPSRRASSGNSAPGRGRAALRALGGPCERGLESGLAFGQSTFQTHSVGCVTSECRCWTCVPSKIRSFQNVLWEHQTAARLEMSCWDLVCFSFCFGMHPRAFSNAFDPFEAAQNLSNYYNSVVNSGEDICGDNLAVL